MHVKIIIPKVDGKKAFSNTGSARRATNYLQQEAQQHGREAVFFSSPNKALLTADEVVAALDGNHKGLRTQEAKFYSLVFAPSGDELAILAGDRRALVAYTQQAMDLYAKNFQLSTGRELHEADLVWAATVHEERKNKGTDAGVQGELKPGLQTHVHVLVSARDVTQTQTLNPQTTPDRFPRVHYQAEVCVQLSEHLPGKNSREPAGEIVASREQRVAEKELDIHARAAANRQPSGRTPAQLLARNERLERRVEIVNSKRSEYQQLDPQQVKAAAAARDYDLTFYRRLGQLETNAEKGIATPAPYAYLTTGLVQRATIGLAVPAGPANRAVQGPVLREELPVFADARQVLKGSLQELNQTLAAQQAAVPPPGRPVAGGVPADLPEPAAAPATAWPALQLGAAAAEKPMPAAAPVAGEQPLPREAVEHGGAVRSATAGEATQDAARQELAAQTRQRVAAVEAAAQRLGASRVFLLSGQGLEVVRQADGQSAGIRHRASGTLFTPDEVPVPPAIQLGPGRALVQYGRVELDALPSASSEQRLEKCRSFLTDVGVTVGQVTPAAAGRAAYLTYCFAPDQGNQERVASQFARLEKESYARIYEAPNPLQTPGAPAVGVAVPLAQWPEREGQFNQVQLVFDSREATTPWLANRLREMLLDYGADVGKATEDGQGYLEMQVCYHTHTPRSQALLATLDVARNNGVDVRQSEWAVQAHMQGIAELEDRSKGLGIAQQTR